MSRPEWRDERRDGHRRARMTGRALLAVLAVLVLVLAAGVAGAVADDRSPVVEVLDVDARPSELAETGVDPWIGALVAAAAIGTGVQLVRLVRAERARRQGGGR